MPPGLSRWLAHAPSKKAQSVPPVVVLRTGLEAHATESTRQVGKPTDLNIFQSLFLQARRASRRIR